jgi:hypothetical protein
MVDNIAVTEGAGKSVRTDDIGAQQYQIVKLAFGADGVLAGIVAAAAPLPVVQTGAIPAGANNIGDVDIASAIPAGANNIGDVDVLTLPALPAGANNIGDVDVLTLPALPAGANNIGDVDVLTINAVAPQFDSVDRMAVSMYGEDGAAGDTAIAVDAAGNVQVDIVASIPAGANNIGDVDVLSLPSIPAGANNIGDVDVLTLPATPAGTNMIGLIQPFAAMLQGTLTELIGINEQVDTDEYGASVGVGLGGTYSGEILSITLYTTEDGTGQILTPAGLLMILDADPATTAGDSDLTAAERVTVIGQVVVEAANWRADANGASVFVFNQPVPFHALATLYFVWFHEDATSFNDAGGDDEQLQMDFWFRRDS